MNQVVCLSCLPWTSEPTRTQQLLARLRGAEILFFEPPARGGRRPAPATGRKVRPNVTVYTLPGDVGDELSALPLIRRSLRKKRDFLARRMQLHGFHSPAMWATEPDHFFLLEGLSYAGLIYDCDRFWPEAAAAQEGQLAAAADVVFAASPALLDRLSPCSGNLVLLPGGVNYPMFCGPQPPLPPALAGLRRPLLALAQPVRAGLDLEPLIHAAATHPDWSFLLLGRLSARGLPARLRRLENVHPLAPPLPLERPDYLRGCDVLLQLLQAGQDDGDLIPGYLYEYLSTGRPIVSMLWPDQVEPFPDVIYAAHSAADFSALCARALSESPGWVTQRRRDYGAAAAWSVRAARVAEILSSIGLYRDFS